MARAITPLLIFRLVLTPKAVFENLANARPSAIEVFFGLAVWLLALPPLFAFVGSTNFGWRLGAGDPLMLSPRILANVSIVYFALLVFGFVTSALIARWMSWTYGARHSLGIHFAMIAVIGAPLAVGSAIHLYPDAFINVLVLVPTLIWSMYLLYRGLPVVLKVSPERGMLMASALIAYFLVAAVSLLGITVVLWGHGIGPRVGI